MLLSVLILTEFSVPYVRKVSYGIVAPMGSFLHTVTGRNPGNNYEIVISPILFPLENFRLPALLPMPSTKAHTVAEVTTLNPIAHCNTSQVAGLRQSLLSQCCQM